VKRTRMGQLHFSVEKGVSNTSSQQPSPKIPQRKKRKKGKKAKANDKETKKRDHLFGRGLGHFCRVTITRNETVSSGRVRCTCENYRRYGICEESRLY